MLISFNENFAFRSLKKAKNFRVKLFRKQKFQERKETNLQTNFVFFSGNLAFFVLEENFTKKSNI